MSAASKLGKVLMIGPGPVRIGHGSELDFAAFSAAALLKESRFDVLAIDANPAGLLAHAARTFIAPVTIDSVAAIIETEKPEFLLPTFGGAQAMSLVIGLNSRNILKDTGIMGLGIDAIKTVGDRMLLKERLSSLGVSMPKSVLALSIDEAEKCAFGFGYPVVVRPAVTGVGRISMVYNVEDLRVIAGGIIGASSPVMIEESLTGWEKLETEILIDHTGGTVIAAFRENLDQMGIHSGDAVAVIPMQTVNEEIQDAMDDISSKIASDLGIKGIANIQFGYDRKAQRLLVLEINPRYSRSSAFAAAANGVNFARIAAGCAAGLTLKEQRFDSTAGNASTAVRIPSFEFEKFDGTDGRLNTRMQSIGASIGIGKDFGTAFGNAMRSQREDPSRHYQDMEKDELFSLISEPSGDRYRIIGCLLEKGASTEDISEITNIRPYFIERMKAAAPSRTKIAKKRVQPGEGPVIIICSGPSRIGEGQELSAMSYETADVIRSLGTGVTAVDSNPYGMASIPEKEIETVISPVCFEEIVDICSKRRARGVIFQTGGVHAQTTALLLNAAGMKVFGTPPDKAIKAESRKGLAALAKKTKTPVPPAIQAGSADEAVSAANRIGFPVIILPETEAPDGRSNVIANDMDAFQNHIQNASFPVYIEKFLEGGFMAQVDAVCDGTGVFIPAIVEHVEHAGIHTGDAACVVPPINIPEKNIAEIREMTARIAQNTGAVGFMNAQFAVYEGKVYCLGVSFRASRTVPLVSKVTGVPMVEYAVKAMLGMKINDMGIKRTELKHFGVREAVFSFDVFPDVDPLIGPEMRSTGQSLGIADNFGLAFARSLAASGISLPENGKVLITVSRNDRPRLLDLAQRLHALGFVICATKGTAGYLNENGIATETVLKVYEGRPNIVDDIKNIEYSLIINTPSGRLSRYDDSYIRKAAIAYKVPYVTTIAGATAAIKGIEAQAHASAPIKP